jgi:transcriptional regulator with XRE-family HTH domain
MTDFFAKWANQSSENARLVAQELLITEVTEAIWKSMEDAGVNKTELAGRMAATKGYVSQVLSGSRNMTLRTLSDICFALGVKPAFVMEDSEANNWWAPETDAVKLSRGGMKYIEEGNLVTPLDHWGRAA